MPKKRVYDDPNIRARLKQLCERKDHIIRPADKGGGCIVFLEKNNYYIEMSRILNYSDTYRPLPKDPTSDLKKTLATLVDRGVQFGNFR